jgi:hypothetical protein
MVDLRLFAAARANQLPCRDARQIGSMPLYFFHVRTNGELIEDTDGVELSDAKSIRDGCLQALGEITAEEEWDAIPAGSEFIIVDELGKTIAVVPIHREGQQEHVSRTATKKRRLPRQPQ